MSIYKYVLNSIVQYALKPKSTHKHAFFFWRRRGRNYKRYKALRDEKEKD